MIKFTSFKLINQLILLLAILLHISLLSNVFAYDIQKEFNFTTSQLPINDSYLLTFNLFENETLYFTQNQTDNNIDLSFVSSHFLNSTSLYNFTINWRINTNIFTENKNINTSIIVSNSVNNNTYEIGLIYNIVKSDPKKLSLNSSSTLEFINGSFIKKITVDKLPEKSNLSFISTGEPKETFSINSCGNFLLCDDSVYRFDDDGRYLINIPIDIPIIPLGLNKQNFTIHTQTNNRTFFINFDVIIPQAFILPPQLAENCYKPNLDIATQLQCEENISRYRLEVIIATAEYFAKINPNSVCKNFVKTEYIVGDSISKEVIETNQKLLSENENLREDILFCEEDKQIFTNQINKLKVEMNDSLIKKDQEITDLIL
ncbi:MAG: hypothetical protein KC589_04790, partial [Nanoarchaeota archaeon]|nr:hypothetical protein [Nanoarchaeota archaeon]